MKRPSSSRQAIHFSSIFWYWKNRKHILIASHFLRVDSFDANWIRFKKVFTSVPSNGRSTFLWFGSSFVVHEIHIRDIDVEVQRYLKNCSGGVWKRIVVRTSILSWRIQQTSWIGWSSILRHRWGISTWVPSILCTMRESAFYKRKQITWTIFHSFESWHCALEKKTIILRG